MRSNTPSHRCAAIKANGTPCQAWAVRGSEPPRCVAHKDWSPIREDSGLPSTSSGNDQLVTEPAAGTAEQVDIAVVLADLYRVQRKLSAYINAHQDELDTTSMARLLARHGANASRLGKLLRDQRALSGDAADGMSKAISEALDELAGELGVDV